MDKNVKAMCKINDVLDERYKKLCDKYNDLLLSYNRKKRALERIDNLRIFVDSSIPDLKYCTVGSIEELHKICNDALFCDGRERSK